MDKKSSFVLYPADFLAAVHNFRKNQVADLIIALCEINFYGELSFKLTDVVKKRFEALQDTINKNNAKYQEICEKRQANGAKGGDKRKAQAKQAESKVKATEVTDSPGESENESESDNENDNGSEEREQSSVDKSEFPGAPTVEEVAEYCRENGYTIDVVAFVNWHNTRGWMHGKRYIALEWRTAVQKWFCKEIGITYSEFKSAGFVAATVLEQAKEAHHDRADN